MRSDQKRCINCNEIGYISEMIKRAVGEHDDLRDEDAYACESCVGHYETQEELACGPR